MGRSFEMMRNKNIIQFATTMLLIFILAAAACAEGGVVVNSSVDFYNRYVWRGLDIARTPSVQPSLSIGYCGFEFGTWGAYTLSNETSDYDEIDFWLSYSRPFDNGVSVTAIITDYYYPNAGIDFFNFNDYDALDNGGNPDPGAHTLEAGLSVTGPPSFPVTVSGYVNFYNEVGNNTYFQVDYPLTVRETSLNFFCGVAGGSKDNPNYYGTDDLQAINAGVTATREVKVSETLTLPLTVSLIVNPNEEISYLLAGLSF